MDQTSDRTGRTDRALGDVGRAAGAVLLLAALVACGTPSSTGASAPATGAAVSPADTSSPSTSSAPAPVATESNPPGDIPDNQAFVAYTAASGGFVVKVPEGWGRTTAGSEVTFTDKLNSVQASAEAAASAPSVASVRSTLVPTLQGSVPKFQLINVVTVTRPAGTGVLVTYLADSAPDPVTNKVVRDSVERYLFWHAGQLVTLTLTGPKGADNVDPWRKVSSSLSWTP